MSIWSLGSDILERDETLWCSDFNRTVHPVTPAERTVQKQTLGQINSTFHVAPALAGAQSPHKMIQRRLDSPFSRFPLAMPYRDSSSRTSPVKQGAIRDPEVHEKTAFYWIPAFAGMTGCILFSFSGF